VPADMSEEEAESIIAQEHVQAQSEPGAEG